MNKNANFRSWTQPNPLQSEKFGPNPIQPNPTHGLTQPTSISGTSGSKHIGSRCPGCALAPPMFSFVCRWYVPHMHCRFADLLGQVYFTSLMGRVCWAGFDSRLGELAWIVSNKTDLFAISALRTWHKLHRNWRTRTHSAIHTLRNRKNYQLPFTRTNKFKNSFLLYMPCETFNECS